MKEMKLGCFLFLWHSAKHLILQSAVLFHDPRLFLRSNSTDRTRVNSRVLPLRWNDCKAGHVSQTEIPMAPASALQPTGESLPAFYFHGSLLSVYQGQCLSPICRNTLDQIK